MRAVLIDGAECLDAEHFGYLKKSLLAEGVQAFIGRVTDTDLAVDVE